MASLNDSSIEKVSDNNQQPRLVLTIDYNSIAVRLTLGVLFVQWKRLVTFTRKRLVIEFNMAQCRTVDLQYFQHNHARVGIVWC